MDTIEIRLDAANKFSNDMELNLPSVYDILLELGHG